MLNQQRIVVYSYRREILEGEEQIYDLIRDLIDGMVMDVMALNAPQRSLSAENIRRYL